MIGSRVLLRAAQRQASQVSKRKMQTANEITIKEAQRPAAKPSQNPIDYAESKTPSRMDKIILVATRVFENKADIPDKVSYTKLGKARDLLRIRINIGWLFLGFIGEACAIMYGRRDQRRGESVFKEQTAKMKALRQEGIQEEQIKKAAQLQSS